MRDDAYNVRYVLASRPDLAPGPMLALARDAHREVRAELLERDDLDAESQEAFARDPDTALRLTLAKRDHLTPAIVLILARDPDLLVRSALVQNQAVHALEEMPAMFLGLALKLKQRRHLSILGGVDSATLDVLLPSLSLTFPGSIRELRESLVSLGPAAP